MDPLRLRLGSKTHTIMLFKMSMVFKFGPTKLIDGPFRQCFFGDKKMRRLYYDVFQDPGGDSHSITYMTSCIILRADTQKF